MCFAAHAHRLPVRPLAVSEGGTDWQCRSAGKLVWLWRWMSRMPSLSASNLEALRGETRLESPCVRMVEVGGFGVAPV